MEKEIAEKWNKLGLLDGLKGHVRDDIAKLYEAQVSYVVKEDKMEKGLNYINEVTHILSKQFENGTFHYHLSGMEAYKSLKDSNNIGGISAMFYDSKENTDFLAYIDHCRYILQLDDEQIKSKLKSLRTEYNRLYAQKMVLQLDMDGVLANFDKKLGELAPDLYLGDGEDYDERSKKVDEICGHKDNCRLFRDLEPIEGAIEAVNELKKYYDVHFLSTPMSAVAESYMDKALWLKEHFGDWSKKRLTLTHNKQRVDGEFLVDDRTKNGAAEFKGEHIHFGQEGFETWDKTKKYLLDRL